MTFQVRTTTVHGGSAAVGAAGPFTLVVDRPATAGGSGLGFNGGQLLYLAVAGCVSNDLFREAGRLGIALHHVEVTVDGGFTGDPAVSTEVTYHVTLGGDAPAGRLRELVTLVDGLAEIPNSLRRGTAVRLGTVLVPDGPG